NRSLARFGAMGNTRGSTRETSATAAIAQTANVNPRTAQAVITGLRGKLPNSSTANPYMRARANSMSARAGASDQSADNKHQVANSPMAPAASATAGPSPSNG